MAALLNKIFPSLILFRYQYFVFETKRLGVGWGFGCLHIYRQDAIWYTTILDGQIFKVLSKGGIWLVRSRNVLFNNALNTFYLRLYGVMHMVKDHSDSERGNPLLPHGLYLISSKGSFICIIPQTRLHIPQTWSTDRKEKSMIPS